jgi:hypothetical protein
MIAAGHYFMSIATARILRRSLAIRFQRDRFRRIHRDNFARFVNLPRARPAS